MREKDLPRTPLILNGANAASGNSSERLGWLDGVRALAALFVVVHHAWIMTVGGYPGNNGPWFTDWMVFGHLAVTVFIVVSGFSLGLSPARHALSFKGGGWSFLQRRFWRIVPPYWAALAFATILIGLQIIEPATPGNYGWRDFTIYAALLQDAFGNVSPNGAFWSIAVEWHIYFLFPLVVIGWRRWGVWPVLTVVASLVVGQHLMGALVPAVALFDRFTPVYFILFVAGGTAAVLAHRARCAGICLWAGASLIAGAILVLGLVDSSITTDWYFWIDLIVGLGTAALFVALSQGRLAWLARALSLSWLARIGEFAYSLYLVHAPILAMLTTFVVQTLRLEPMTELWLLLGLGVPASLGGAYVFFLACERPFLAVRTWKDLKPNNQTQRQPHPQELPAKR
jgi:peptidoglycan/LPS O-acetylase OafA/YrhL